MMLMRTMPAAIHTDAELVGASLAGNRDAFGKIVARYQSLVCSLAYSATGSLSQSEDLAQETFVAAWKQLAGLREPEKLRAWLCGIARNITSNSLRKQGREPSHRAESLDEISESHSPEPQPVEQTISNEEQAILWRSLERIPEIYREPLVLFYREHQSIEAVAQNLELTEDAVKQRLSRGRKLLHEQVLAFVEGALERTNPGKVFTLGVLAALPALTISAKAATLGAAAAKGSATAKAAGAMGLFGAAMGLLVVFFGNYACYRIGLDEAGSDAERGRVKALHRQAILFSVIFYLVFALLSFWVCRNQLDHALLLTMLTNGLIVIYLMTYFGFAMSALREHRRYLSGLLAREFAGQFPKPAWEYRSRFSLFGLPAVHICIGDRFDALKKPVTAWFAVGNFALGGLFAFGGVAVAPISIGLCAVGLLPFGAIALGLLVVGGFGVGVWSFGVMAVGWQAFGCCAVAWNAASGGVALAHDFALGGIAHAAQFNNAIAGQVIGPNLFFRFSQSIVRYVIWLNLLWVVPVALQSRVVARARRRREQGNF
jgi:RNA polymerase sigma factor (sigma-70 family)